MYIYVVLLIIDARGRVNIFRILVLGDRHNEQRAASESPQFTSHRAYTGSTRELYLVPIFIHSFSCGSESGLWF
jgi:hypothetical protein